MSEVLNRVLEKLALASPEENSGVAEEFEHVVGMSYVVFDRFGEDYDVVDEHQAVAVEIICLILNLQKTITLIMFGNYQVQLHCQLSLQQRCGQPAVILTFSLASNQRLDQNSACSCICATVVPTFATNVSRSNGRLSIPTAMQTCISVVPRSNGRSNLEHSDVFRPLCQLLADTRNRPYN